MHSLYALLWEMNTKEKKVKFEHLQNFKNQSENPFYYNLKFVGKIGRKKKRWERGRWMNLSVY